MEWTAPVGAGMYPVFLLVGVSALFLAIGYHYRAASILYFVLYTYAFLLDKAQYNNHYYLICLLAFLFAVTNADRGFSIDALRRRLPSQVPAWQVYLFRLQVCVVFFHAGVAKINSVWMAGEPVRTWLAARSDYFLIGPLLLQEWFGIGAKAVLVSGFVLVQLLAPLRHFAIPGNVAWTEEGHLFSWRMKLGDKRADEIAFYTRDPHSGNITELSTDELTKGRKKRCPRAPI